jgi:O-acetyl-ADP-ribose deacetylase (regulator of RNase III)
MIEFVQGDMFATRADIRVNTVNCVGVMGAGAALAFKQRYPEMFKDYQNACNSGRVKPGKLHVWKSLDGDWIVNFPTKRHWKEKSRYEDIEAGLDDLRKYLDTLGPVTIAMPALGCGHGGLDWSRVSKIIENKLEGVNANIKVFAPQDSRQAGHTAAIEPTPNELQSAEHLGYARISNLPAKELGLNRSAFVKGDVQNLAANWIALLPSKSPGDRERRALDSIAAEMARRDSSSAVALIHSSRTTEEIAQIFAGHNIKVILLLPFGVLTRKPIAHLSSSERFASITLVSLATPSAKWNRPCFAETLNLLQAQASAILLSDPKPDWFFHQSTRKAQHPPIFYLRYDALQDNMHDELARKEAAAIGRRPDSGTPNIDDLLGSQKQSASVQDLRKDMDHREFTPDLFSTPSASLDDSAEHVSVDLLARPRSQWAEIIELLKNADAAQLTLDAHIPKSAKAETLRRDLLNLSRKQSR